MKPNVQYFINNLFYCEFTIKIVKQFKVMNFHNNVKYNFFLSDSYFQMLGKKVMNSNVKFALEKH